MPWKVPSVLAHSKGCASKCDGLAVVYTGLPGLHWEEPVAAVHPAFAFPSYRSDASCMLHC